MSPSHVAWCAVDCGAKFVRQKRRNQDGSTVTYLQLVDNKRRGQDPPARPGALGRADDPKLPANLGRPACPAGRWTESRIQGHVMVCFLAFVLRQILTQRLAKLGWQGSFTELLAALGRVRVTVLQGKGGQTFRLRDEIPACAMPALPAVGMQAPRRLERLG